MSSTDYDESNPNTLVYRATQKPARIAAKDALKFLEKKGVIHSFDWSYEDNDPDSWEFEVWAISPDHAPLVFDTDEALAFCRGAKAQERNLQEAGS